MKERTAGGRRPMAEWSRVIWGEGFFIFTAMSTFGHDFASVRVHIDERAAASAASFSARAYTVGRHIVFGRGAGARRPGEWAGRLHTPASRRQRITPRTKRCAARQSWSPAAALSESRAAI